MRHPNTYLDTFQYDSGTKHFKYWTIQCNTLESNAVLYICLIKSFVFHDKLNSIKVTILEIRWSTLKCSKLLDLMMHCKPCQRCWTCCPLT